MKGFVPTPTALVDRMVRKLFDSLPPSEDALLLDPGCGTGAFLSGVLRWARATGHARPGIVGIESNPALLAGIPSEIKSAAGISLLKADFLEYQGRLFDYIIGNPPYVPITGLSEGERSTYRSRFVTATGRFDLYSLFFEQALRLLKPGGRLVFVTPEKFIYVESARRLRQQLAEGGIEEIEFLDEGTFEGLVTYPVVTTVGHKPDRGTLITLRTKKTLRVRLSALGSSWMPLLNGSRAGDSKHVAAEAFRRISCGVATGADRVYMMKASKLPEALRPYSYPTISGRALGANGDVEPSECMLVPYSPDGTLLPEKDLGPLGVYLRTPENYSRLLGRTCTTRKPWYAFHETPPLEDILRPKILCKDIARRPHFVIDRGGEIVPRHSVYYLVPAEEQQIDELCDYLNSQEVTEFLRAHCQRAANGYLRLQSHVLKRIPIPQRLVSPLQLSYV